MVDVGSLLSDRFRLDRLVGRGGFASVYLSTDLLLDREVAIKILDSRLGDDQQAAEFLERFRREARAVAALDHPNILGIYDYGESDGVIYLIMPYVDGGTLHERLLKGPMLNLGEISAFLRQAASALDYAHRRNIVHRDVKPRNMLLRAEDDRLLLADFGIARALSGVSNQTQTKAIGTLAYMAPEQLRGSVSPLVDQYALGCVLFEMLAGRTPYSGQSESMIFGHLQEPVPRLADQGRADLPPGVQAVLDRALAKQPGDRFASAGAMVAAFDAALGITARLTTAPTPHALPETRHETAALPEVAGATSSPTIKPGPADAGGVAAAPKMHLSAPAAGDTSAVTGSVSPQHPAVPRIESGEQVSRPASLPGAATPRSRVAPSLTGGIALVALVVTVTLALFSQRDRWLSSGSLAGGIEPAIPTATATTGATVTTAAVIASPTPAPSPSPASSASPTATAITPTATAKIVPPTPLLKGETQATLAGHTDHVRSVIWIANGQMLVTGGDDGQVKIWQRGVPVPLASFSGRTFAVTSVALSPDGGVLAVGSDDNLVHLWRLDGTVIATLAGHTDHVVSVAWSPDGKMLASASSDQTIRLWTATGQPVGQPLRGHTGPVQSVAWSSTGLLASASWDGTVRLWRSTGQVLATLSGHTDQVWAVAWAPDGKTLASASRDGTVRLWSATGMPLATLRGHTSFVSSVAWSPDGRYLASGSFDNTVRVWTADGQAVQTLVGHTNAVTSVAWSPDGRMLASGSWDNTARIWH